jgi:hypothetical protein
MSDSIAAVRKMYRIEYLSTLTEYFGKNIIWRFVDYNSLIESDGISRHYQEFLTINAFCITIMVSPNQRMYPDSR